MPFVPGDNREQITLSSIESLVSADSPARLIDAFVDSLDLGELGFDRATAAAEGRPAYDGASLLKLYIYGNLNRIRSSRQLARACEINVEVMWLMRGLKPDFRTIAGFRKRNAGHLKDVFKSFDKKVFEVVESGFLSVDGTKMAANCASKNSFTKENIEESLKRLAGRLTRYMKELEKEDKAEEAQEAESLTRSEIEQKVKDTQERLERYTAYRDYMEKNGLAQMCLTDADARIMKTKDGFGTSYNVQTAVDSETHMIRNFEVTNQCTDHGLLEPTVKEIRDQNPDGILEATADRGYEDQKDLVSCLENGIIPNVIPKCGKDKYEMETAYEEAEITDEIRASRQPEDIKKCLRAGEVPDAYKDCVEVEVIDTYRAEKKAEEPADSDLPASPYLTPEEAKERAAKGYFVRNPESNTVICPAGETLPQKSVSKNGKISYANRALCKNCEHRSKCLNGRQTYKTISFSKDELEKPNRTWQLAAGDGFHPRKPRKRGPLIRMKVVKITFKPDKAKMDKRKELSEHPFGTIKRSMGAGYLLLRGKLKVTGEVALICMGYNIKRALNLLGFEKLMEAIQ